MAQCTRNKIAQATAAALRVLPAASSTLSQLQETSQETSQGTSKEPDRVSKNLDEIDLRILSEIQADGRITNVELAKRVGISPPPCLRRVRTLEEEGYIQGYRGLLDPRRLGFDVTVFASVHLSSQAEADLRAFEEFVRAEPLVRECWMLSGEVDFILKCVAPDMATFQDFVTHLTSAPHVRNVRTSLVLHNSKYEAAVPLDLKVAG
jgi:DNA-binding Lrp family transcriptional regulator